MPSRKTVRERDAIERRVRKAFRLKKGNGGEFFIVFQLPASYCKKYELPRGVGSVMCGTAWLPAARVKYECFTAAVAAAIRSLGEAEEETKHE